MLPLTKLPRYIVQKINIHALELTINNNKNLGFQIQNHQNPKRLRIIWYYYQNRAISMLIHSKYKEYKQYTENMEYYQKNFHLDGNYRIHVRKSHSHYVLYQYTKELEYIYNTYANQVFKDCWISTHDQKIARSYEYIRNKYTVYKTEIKFYNGDAYGNVIIYYTQGRIENIVINRVDLNKQRSFVPG
jgi:hypothetical protein